jgi:3-deoxy-D-manno-octulosonate 8-phosphate phosphatase (KDO 8-P phosphatase)
MGFLRIRMIVSDVDGVWTDGSVLYGARDVELKAFHVRDGLAVKLAQKAGIEVVIVTGRSSRALERRCRELGINQLHQGVNDKLAAVKEILTKNKLTFEQLCYVGDDLPDLAVLNNAAISAAPADAVPEVLEAVRWRLDTRGGKGAFRETVERLLKARGEWDAIVKEFHGAQISIQST